MFDPTLAQERLLTLREVANMTSLSRSTIYRQIAAGRFPVPVKIGRNTRWPRSEVVRYVDTLVSSRDRAAAGDRASLPAQEEG